VAPSRSHGMPSMPVAALRDEIYIDDDDDEHLDDAIALSTLGLSLNLTPRPGVEWPCSVCTYVNPPGRSHCDMCQTPAVVAITSHAPAAVPATTGASSTNSSRLATPVIASAASPSALSPSSAAVSPSAAAGSGHITPSSLLPSSVPAAQVTPAASTPTAATAVPDLMP
jgi:hypothetical protein